MLLSSCVGRISAETARVWEITRYVLVIFSVNSFIRLRDGRGIGYELVSLNFVRECVLRERERERENLRSINLSAITSTYLFIRWTTCEEEEI